MMRRRDVLAAVAGTSTIWPSSLAAQQLTRRPRVGVLVYSTPDRDPSIQAFLRSMRELGYIDGQNISYEFRSAEGKPERLPELAADLVRLKPDVLFASGGDVTPWIAKATQTIPIIYSSSADPVKIGLAASLAKPGGNATGVTLLSDELAAKRIQLFKAAVPRIFRVGFLRDPTHADNEEPIAQRSAVALGVEIHPVPVHGSADFDRALAAAAEARIDGLYVVSSRHTALNMGASSISRQKPFAAGWRLGRVGAVGRASVLRAEHGRHGSAVGHLRGQGPQGCEDQRFAGPAADTLRAAHQS
jgi:putative ABC transport system substrate-binding protein